VSLLYQVHEVNLQIPNKYYSVNYKYDLELNIVHSYT